MEHYLPLITGSAGALVVLALGLYAFYIGKLHSDREFSKLEHENDALRTAYDRLLESIRAERVTVNEQAAAARVNIKLIDALTRIARERRDGERSALPSPEDLGL